MSQVRLLAADRPLPLCDQQEEHTSTVMVRGEPVSITIPRGFLVEEHLYYRSAVDALDYPIKPWRYELELEAEEADLNALKAYLAENLHPGETAELWSIWLSDDVGKRPPHYRGTLADFDLETLRQFLEPGQRWLSVTI